MPKPFSDLRERLLKAGVAPGRVRRYLRELSEHHADLVEEARASRLGEEEARAAASARLGDADELVRAMVGRPELQSWGFRAPGTFYGLLPLLGLGGCYLAACLILWSGWRLFLPTLPSPFVPITGYAAVYFGVGRFLFIGGPILVGWLSGLLAVRQRLASSWPVCGIALVAVAGSAARVRLHPSEAGRVDMVFSLGRTLPAIGNSLWHAAVLFVFALLPVLAWQAAQAGRQVLRD
jgi:hypothetical protein